MMRAFVVLVLAGAAVGCRSYVEIFDGAAEKGEGGEIVVRFRAHRDITQASQFFGASLLVPAQIDAGKTGADDALERGHSRAGPDKVAVVSEQPPYVFEARFPLKGEYVHEHQAFFSRTSIRHPYDLSVPGVHELEVWANGANCGGPGGFYTQRLRLTYLAR